ncbi:FAD-dependent oxidoreductase [Phytoactinopolyspora sp. XMNu-373]|uniref:FAD-dependent oxidoreductase n=1 Tax=Phytoactinopolyspora mesophila TaxID=2650750 RepID=A0A7K3M6K9_9ACTN|nr:FAD-dependent oxidoreductase [Phytoactinopolyspora mesophila]
MMNRRVLISGASVAGLTAAYWFHQYGFPVTVVERFAGLRPGGHAIDVRGTALDVAERMGVLGGLRDASTSMRGMSIVDQAGNELSRSTEETLSGGALGGADVEVMRDDLCEALYATTRADVEYIFGDAVAGIELNVDEVRVTLESGPPRSVDLVVGADGLHSTVRRLAFGPESSFLHHLGNYVGVFTTPNFLDLDYWQVWMQMGDRGGVIMSARDNAEARVYLGFGSEQLDYDYRDIGVQKRLLADQMAGAGWEVPRMLEFMWEAEDFHFDSMSQIRMDRWSSDRISLVGDAGYAGSPLSGQGTSVAMVGAYILVDELNRANGDHRRGYAAYESRMRTWVEQNQQLALLSGERHKAAAEGRDPARVEGPVLDDVKSAIALGHH